MTGMADPLRGLGNVTPATRQKAAEILAAATSAGHKVSIVWGFNPASRPEHSSGRALDFMVDDKAAGDWIADYVWRHRTRLGLRHVIWWQRIRSTVTAPGVWRTMSDRGSVTQNHRDHPHIWFLDDRYEPLAAQVDTDGYPGAPLAIGAHGAAVTRVQARLGGVPVTGTYDTATRDRVGYWQAVFSLPITGVVGAVDWLVLIEGKPRPTLTVDGRFGPQTISALQARLGAQVTGIMDRDTITRLQAHMRDWAIRDMQVDGVMGPQTRTGIQIMVGAPLTGELDAATIAALQRWLNAR